MLEVQKAATKVFVISSITFGVLGVLLVLAGSSEALNQSDLMLLLFQCLMLTVFIILPSFAVSLAGRFLIDTRAENSRNTDSQTGAVYNEK